MYMLSGPPSNHTAEPLSMPPIRHTYSCHHLREPPPASPALQCRAMYMMSVPRAVTLPYRSPCRRLRVPCHRLGGRAASPSVPPTMQRVTPCMPSVKTGLPRHHQRRAVSLRDRPTAANALRHAYPSPPPPPPLLPPSGSGRVTDQLRGFTTLPRLPRRVPYARYRTAPVPREGHHLILGSDPAASYKQRSGRPRPGCPFHVSVGRHPGEARNMCITGRVMRTACSASLVRCPRRLRRWPPVLYTGGSLPRL